MEKVFELGGLAVMPFWLGMIFAPRWSVTRRVMASVLPPLIPAAIYLVLIAPNVGQLLPLLMRPQLGPISALLGTELGATVGWMHFLAFDLFVGRWIFLDARERGITAWIVSPILFLTLMFGPVGLLAYLAIRRVIAHPTQLAVSTTGGVP